MKIFAYYLRTDSGDEFLKMSYNDYKGAIDFMKNEVSHEYECWHDDEDYEDEDIPYAEFLKKEMEIENGIEKVEKLGNGSCKCHDWEFSFSDGVIRVLDNDQGDIIGHIEDYTIDELIKEIDNKPYEQVRDLIRSVIEYY